MVIGKFQRNADGNFVGWVQWPESAPGDRLRCLMVQDGPELGFGYDFMQLVWLDRSGMKR